MVLQMKEIHNMCHQFFIYIIYIIYNNALCMFGLLLFTHFQIASESWSISVLRKISNFPTLVLSIVRLSFTGDVVEITFIYILHKNITKIGLILLQKVRLNC